MGRPTIRTIRGFAKLDVCHNRHMATNLKIDDSLVDEVLKLSGFRTKREAVTLALEEFISRRRQQQILELEGKIDFDPDFDYKQYRRRA